MLPLQRANTVANVLQILVLLCQVWLCFQAATKKTYSYESKYISSYMKVISTGAYAYINPKTSDIDKSDYSIKIHPYKIEEKTYGGAFTLSTKEYSMKESDTYDGVSADSVTFYSSIQDGSIKITYTLFKTRAVNQTYPSTADFWVDVEVTDWTFCKQTSCSGSVVPYLDIIMEIEAKKGIFKRSTSNMFNSTIVQSDWSNTDIPLQLYSIDTAKLNGVETKIHVSSVNTTNEKITYTIRTPKFDNTFSFSAIWFHFPRAMPSTSAAMVVYPAFLLQFILCVLGFVKFII